MNNIGKLNARCSCCSNETTVDAYSSVNVFDYPELKEKVLDGSLFIWECPHCGHRNLLTYETLYHDPESKLMIWLRSDNSIDEARLNDATQQLEGYTLRRVSSIGDLIEKVSVHETGLDDLVIELCKYVTKMELAEKLGDKIFDTAFKFYKITGADNEITLSFPWEGALQGLNIGFNVYEDCRGIIQRNPAIQQIEGFAKIDADWISHFLR